MINKDYLPGYKLFFLIIIFFFEQSLLRRYETLNCKLYSEYDTCNESSPFFLDIK